jgi:hypothetical protein
MHCRERLVYAHLVVALPVWIESWAYQCCGQRRSVGDAVTVALACDGVAEATNGPEGIHVEPDGSVRVVGRVVGQAPSEHGDEPAALVQCGDTLQFAAASGEGLVERVRCTGRLWETGHGFSAGVTSGRLLDIRWHPALLRRTAERTFVVEGYGDGRELRCTDDWPREDADTWALELSLWLKP